MADGENDQALEPLNLEAEINLRLIVLLAIVRTLVEIYLSFEGEAANK